MDYTKLTLNDLFFRLDNAQPDCGLAWVEIVRRNGYTIEEYNKLSNPRKEWLEEDWRDEAEYEAESEGINEIVKRVEAELKESDMSKIGRGVFIETRQSMIKQQTEQTDWSDDDPIDFSEFPYWVTTDDGQEPFGYNSVGDAIQMLRKGGYL